MSDPDFEVETEDGPSTPAVKIRKRRPAGGAQSFSDQSLKGKKAEMVSQVQANCARFPGVISVHKITFFRIFQFHNSFKRCREEFGWPLTGAVYDFPHPSSNVKQWNRFCVNPFQWRLIDEIMNKLFS